MSVPSKLVHLTGAEFHRRWHDWAFLNSRDEEYRLLVPFAVVCTDDLNRFSGADVMDDLRTNPLVIMGGLLHENPFLSRRRRFSVSCNSAERPAPR